MLEIPGDITQNMEDHGSIAGKMMMRDICFYYKVIATSPLPSQVTDEEDDF